MQKILIKKSPSAQSDQRHKTYSFTGETVFPIHIGTGTYWSASDYILIKDTIYRVELAAILQVLDSENQKKMISLIDKGDAHAFIGLRKFFVEYFSTHKSDLDRIALYKAKASTETKTQYEHKLSDFHNQLLIQPTYRAGLRLCIPGSSLKGAIRTALMQRWINEDAKHGRNTYKYQDIEDEIDATFANNRYKMNRNNNELQKLAGDYGDAKNDPLRCLKVSDAMCSLDAESKVVQVYNLDMHGNKKVPQTVECIPAGVSFSGEVVIDQNLPGIHVPNHKGNDFQIKKTITITQISNACMLFYSKVLAEEYQQYSHFFDGDSFQRFSDLVEIWKSDRSTSMVRLGRFSHVEAVTFQPPYRKPDAKKGYGKSRNYAVSGKRTLPFGLIRLAFTSLD